MRESLRERGGKGDVRNVVFEKSEKKNEKSKKKMNEKRKKNEKKITYLQMILKDEKGVQEIEGHTKHHYHHI